MQSRAADDAGEVLPGVVGGDAKSAKKGKRLGGAIGQQPFLLLQSGMVVN